MIFGMNYSTKTLTLNTLIMTLKCFTTEFTDGPKLLYYYKIDENKVSYNANNMVWRSLPGINNS